MFRRLNRGAGRFNNWIGPTLVASRVEGNFNDAGVHPDAVVVVLGEMEKEERGARGKGDRPGN